MARKVASLTSEMTEEEGVSCLYYWRRTVTHTAAIERKNLPLFSLCGCSIGGTIHCASSAGNSEVGLSTSLAS